MMGVRDKSKSKSRGMTEAQRALFESHDYAAFLAAIRADPRFFVFPNNPSYWCEVDRSFHPDTTPCVDGRLKCLESRKDRR